MAKYVSGRQKNLKVGISSYSENLTSIQVIGNVGIATTNATSKLYVVGDGYFTGVVTATNINVSSSSSFSQLYVSGITTLAANGGITTTGGDLYVGGDLYIADDLVFDEFNARNGNITGIATIDTLKNTVGTITNLGGTNINYSGVGTIATLNSTVASITNLSGTNVNYSGVGTIARLNSTVATLTNLDGTNINYTGVGTITTLRVITGIITNINSSGIITATQFTTGSGNLGFTTNTISGPQEIIIDPLPVGVGTTSGSVRIKGDLYVDGTQFIVNSTTIELADFNVGIATTVGNDLLLDGAGIGIGSQNIRKTLTWDYGDSAFKSSENFDLTTDKVYKINGATLLSSSQLTVPNIDISGVGTIATLNSNVGTIQNLSGTNINYTGVGTITTLSSTNGTITNLSGTIGTITTLSSTNGTITNLGGTNINYTGVGTITTLSSTNGTITNLSGTIGTITTLSSTNGTITNLSGTIGTITTLSSTNGTITNLSGTIGTITTLSSTNGTITNLSGTIGTITTLRVITGIITNINSSGITTLTQLGVNGLTTTSQLVVSGISTLGVVTASQLFVSGVATATTFIGALTGIAASATQLVTPRTFQITGDVIASAISFDGTGNVSLAATIQPNSVGLGTDTTGDYVQSISGTGNQITVTSGTGEGSTPTLSIPNQFTIPQDATVTRDLQVNRNLSVTGNVTIGGTSAIIFSQSLNIFDPDIILGFRTDANGNDVSNDTTANHGGVALASTEGSPLVQLFVAGIETNPATYKKIMWFKAGTFAGLGTDAWLSNYAVGIGSTQFPVGTRLAAGAVQFSERDLAVVRNINASGIVTATTGNITTINGTTANYSIGNIVTGVITNAQGTNLNYSGVGTITTFNATTSTTTNVNGTNLNFSGVGTIATLNSTSATLTNLGGTNVNYTGIGTITRFNSTVGTITNLGGTNVNYSGIATVGSLNIGATQVISSARQLQNIASLDATTTATIEAAIANAPNTFTDLNVTGISTLGITSATSLTAQQLNVSGLSTFNNNINIASGIITTTGNSGVGIGSFLRLKAYQSNEGGEIAFEYINGSTGYYLDVGPSNVFRFSNYDAAGTYTFFTNSAERLRITNAGLVGIGSASPTTTLDVIGTVKAGTALTSVQFGGDNGRNIEIGIGATNISTFLDFHGADSTYSDYATRLIRDGGDNGNFNIINRGTGSLRLVTQDAGVIDILTQNTFRHRIDSNGVILVGTANSTGTASQLFQVNSGGYFNGNLGVGNTNPTSTLMVQGDGRFVSSGQGDVSITHSSLVSTIRAAASVQLALGAGGAEAVRINTSGNVGINSTTPTSKLDVVGDVKVSGVVTATTFSGQINSGIATITTLNVTTSTTTNATGTNLNFSGVGTIATLNSTVGTITNATGTNLNFSGVGTIATLNSTVGTITNLGGTNINYTGVSTLTNATGTNLNFSGVGTIATLNVTNSSITNINSTGIITATQFTTGSGNLGFTTNTISGPQEIIIDPLPVGVGTTSGIVRIRGDLYVDGTQFVVNSTTIELADFNVGIASTVGTNTLLDGAGIGIGSANIRKTFTYNNSANTLESSIGLGVTSGGAFKTGTSTVLTSTTLGSSVVNSSLTSVGTLGQLNVSGVSTFQSDVKLGDNDKLILGDGNDLQIYHDGSNSTISDVGTGKLLIYGNDGIFFQSTTSGDYFAKYNSDGSVELYHDNSKKFETAGYGATVFGTLQSQGLNVSGITTSPTYDTVSTRVGSATSTTTTTSQTAIHTGLSTSLYRSVEYMVQGTRGTNYHSTKILVIHDGVTAYLTEYGTVYNNATVASYDVDISGENLRLLATPSSASSTTFKVSFISIVV